MLSKKKTFTRGIHPPENKSLTETKSIETMPQPEMVIIPLQQHIGAPSEPIVNIKDQVKIGDKLSESKGVVSVPSHASISGTVKKIEPCPHPLGVDVLSIVIETDGQNKLSDAISDEPDYKKLASEEIINRIKNAGIAGMGGATFPTHVKLSPPPQKKIDTFILNGAECEPYLTADHRLMLEYTKDILSGMQLMMQVLNCSNGFIGIENNKPDAIETMRRVVSESGYKYQVIGFEVKYPQGAEKQLIKACVNREVPRGGLPMDAGCLVQNVGTAKAVYDAVARHKPLIDRVVTITGNGIQTPKNVLVPIGTRFSDVIAFCGGLTDDASKIVNGGPMMGIAQYTLDVPVIKGTSGILCLNDAESKFPDELACISCARCVDGCPMGLMPNLLGTYCEYKKFDEAKQAGILDCIECGSCAYICPAKRRLVQWIKFGKLEVNRMQKTAA
ncbi:electron transport complex subunit RsxC [candidate division KSB1 bacterium]|nr:electron transport complex subunit RsxC [candidate division KSB1 bacterium]